MYDLYIHVITIPLFFRFPPFVSQNDTSFPPRKIFETTR